MPNWCFNRIDISHPNIMEIVNLLESDESPFDFEKIVPMPPILKTTTSGRREFEIDGQKVTLDAWFVPNTGDFIADQKQSRPFTPEEQAALDAIGCRCWYDWALANWGTKWNSSRAEREVVDNDFVHYSFHTAWSPPTFVIDALRERFPYAHITAFYDEPGMRAAGYY